MTNIVRVEVVKGKMGEIGSIVQLYYNNNGQISIIEDKLIYYEAGNKYVSQRVNQSLNVLLETTFRSLKNASKMSLVWSGKGNYFIVRLLIPLM
jgi:hypothetical protein